jgi:transcription elongation factor Elf1
MKIIRKLVYYCDHCGKRYLSRAAINKHERGCTANPKRVCGVCGNTGPVQTEPFAQYLEPAPVSEDWQADVPGATRQVVEGRYDPFIAEVHDAVNGCPACMLAIIRQLRITRIAWDYKAARDAYWAEINAEHLRQEAACGYHF